MIRALVAAALAAASAHASALVSEARGLRAHPLHTSVTELSYGTRDAGARLVIRVAADDYSAAVARFTRTAPATDHTVPPAASFAYLRATVALLDRAGRALPLTTCGERRVEDAMLICLTSSATLPDGARLRNAILLELFDDQVNVVNARRDEARRTLLFTKGTREQRLP